MKTLFWFAVVVWLGFACGGSATAPKVEPSPSGALATEPSPNDALDEPRQAVVPVEAAISTSSSCSGEQLDLTALYKSGTCLRPRGKLTISPKLRLRLSRHKFRVGAVGKLSLQVSNEGSEPVELSFAPDDIELDFTGEWRPPLYGEHVPFTGLVGGARSKPMYFSLKPGGQASFRYQPTVYIQEDDQLTAVPIQLPEGRWPVLVSYQHGTGSVKLRTKLIVRE